MDHVRTINASTSASVGEEVAIGREERAREQERETRNQEEEEKKEVFGEKAKVVVDVHFCLHTVLYLKQVSALCSLVWKSDKSLRLEPPTCLINPIPVRGG